MAERSASKSKKAEAEPSPFRIRPLRQAKKESKVGGELFDTADELFWVMSQLRLLRHWPLTKQRQEGLGSDLDFSKVVHDGQEFYELRLDDARLHRTNLRVFFWVYGQRARSGSSTATGRKTRSLRTRSSGWSRGGSGH